MKDLLTFILTNIIDHPDQLIIEEETEDDLVRFNVTLAEEDYPRVIGKGGMTIKGITDIVRLHSARTEGDISKKVYVNIHS